MKHARFMRIEEQWSVIYLPERPNGFAVFLLSNNGLVVEKNTSDWEQHPEKALFLEDLLKRGYTVVAGSLYGNHWGSQKAFHLLIQLYHTVMKQEILNKKVHLFAEGTGAILAMRWIEAYSNIIRSCYLINPCLSLITHYEQEQENRLYYKRFVKEMEKAYDLGDAQINEDWIRSITPEIKESTMPPLSIHCSMQDKQFPLHLHSRPFQKQLAERKLILNLRIHGNEKSFYKAAQSSFPFFQKYEKVL